MDAKNKMEPLEGVELRPWQIELEEITQGPVDNRAIYWYWSEQGDVGKSFMATYFLCNHGATVLSGGNVLTSHTCSILRR